MCVLDFSVTFKLDYKCDYGQSVYVVGSIESLGNWNPYRGLRLDWFEGHIWSKKVIITHDNTKQFEYKYIIAPTDLSTLPFEIKWEDGSNRLINLLTVSKLCIKLDDEWEHRKVRIALHDHEVKNYIEPYAKLYLETHWGLEKKSVMMKMKRQRYTNMHHYNFWSASLQVPYKVSDFQYRFKVEDENGRLKNLLTQPYHTFSYNKCCRSKREDTFYLHNGGTLIKFDFSLHLPMGFNKITDQIYVGEFPKTEQDVEALASQNIRGVLNLQTYDDMKRYGVNWESLKKCYQKFNIEVEHLPITDMDTDELTLKIEDTGDIIHKLIQENEKVYVHCTAGKYRSPHAVIFYLWHYKKYELDKAISLVKSRRKRTKIFEKVFSQKIRA